ncbi:MAG: 4Fe-4S dicluster-binding protein [Desulfobacteraceae bacterium]|jgi:Pyruvate/2-oxoacid:ferredoxin oxidoreductase delta subunit|nr:4Fe-4S dicluster-binding protein [Desulfobacteraceae bacterium]
MAQNDQVYIRLQKHLDRQPVGFPATRSGVEIKILKHIFTPEEAEIVSFLNYKPEPLKTIFRKVRHLVESPDKLDDIIDLIQKKGGIESTIKNGSKHYCCAPLVVGMYELQLDRLTPEFIKDFNEYTSDIKFGIEFLSTELPQMRTIPVSRSIHPQHNVSTFDEVTTLLQQAEDPFVIIECICRKKKSMEGKSCEVTDRKETCLAIGGIARTVLQSGTGREITRDEALTIIEQNQKQGLVLQPSNTEKAEFICSCCGCCCGMLAVHKIIPKPLDFWASNFQAEVDRATCVGCGSCEEWCQVGAVSVSESSQKAAVDLNRCIGCGVCVSNCPTESISLLKKPTEVRPPQTREDLYEIIMAKKKGRFGKLKLTGKMLIDAVRTGQTNLLRS